MNPEIRFLKEKKLVGSHITTSLSNNRTFELWKSFMPRRGEISGALSDDLISLQIYDKDYFTNFNPDKEFEKWALKEVSDFDKIPAGMQQFILPGGTYVVFVYQGLASDFGGTIKYMLNEWLPQSGYALDSSRPHFEVLGDKYKRDSPDSEEEVWMPVKLK